MKRNWRTTVLGICAILTAVAGFVKATIDGDTSTEPDIAALVAAFTAGLGLLFAKDLNVTGLPGDGK